MKKFTKIMLIIAAVMTGIGVACMVMALALGATKKNIIQMIDEDKFVFHIGNTGIFGYDAGSDSQMIDQECTRMDIDFEAGTLWIYYDDVEQIQIDQENIYDFEAYVEKGTLHIDGEANNPSEPSITIVIPEKTKWEHVELNLGASQADIDGLIADTVDIEVGAGEANIWNLDVKDLTAETGIGSLSIEVTGQESDYNYNVECGIGTIQIGENSYGGMGTTQKLTNENAKKQILAECGIGEILIEFLG